MPHLHNGIGTWYLGKRNVRKYKGVCSQCRKMVQMSAYETRTWILVLFVPVVPLRKLQIFDDCPLCRQHRCLPLRKWQQIVQKEIHAAGEHAAADPDDPQRAVQFHATLESYLQHAEAARVAESLAEHFGEHAFVQLHLGQWHDRHGRNTEADRCFEKALELAPEDHVARRAVAIGAIERGELPRAAELLEFMEAPGPDSDPHVLTMLAQALQWQGNHAEALRYFRLITERWPAMAVDKKLRKQINLSEKALGLDASPGLRPPPNHRRRWVICGLIAAALAVIFLLDHWFAQNQQLFVVNRLPAGVRVTIDDQEPLALAADGRRQCALAEGAHKAVIHRDSGGEETAEFEISNNPFQRWFDSPVFVLNPGKAADFLWEETVYTSQPVQDAGDFKLHFGESFLTFRNVDYPFQPFPPQIQTKNSSVRKSRVDVLAIPPPEVLGNLARLKSNDLLAYAEHHLACDPPNDELLEAYTYHAANQGELERCRNFLTAGLDRRPIWIEWHRNYQSIMEMIGNDGGLISTYDRLLKESPGSSALLYLRGRLCVANSEANAYFDKAIAADGKNPFPLLAKGMHAFCVGDVATAQTLCGEARRLAPRNEAIADALFAVRCSTRDYKNLQIELQKAQQEKPLDFTVYQRLLEVLIADGKHAEAAACHQAYLTRMKEELHGQPSPALLYGELTFAYLSNNLDDYLRKGAEIGDAVQEAYITFEAHLEQDDLNAAESALERILATQKPPGPTAARAALLLSLAWKAQNNSAKADRWHAKGIELLRACGSDWRRCAELLSKGSAVEIDEIDEAFIHNDYTTTILVMLADRCPKHRETLLTRAEKLGGRGVIPQRFVNKAMAALRK